MTSLTTHRPSPSQSDVVIAGQTERVGDDDIALRGVRREPFGHYIRLPLPQKFTRPPLFSGTQEGLINCAQRMGVVPASGTYDVAPRRIWTGA
jgi:hypothetical protein